MPSQRDKGFKGCKNNKQKATRWRRKIKTVERDRHTEMFGSPKYFEIVRVLPRSEEVFPCYRVSSFLTTSLICVYF